MKWSDSCLCKALTSLDLHRRVVSLALDGSLSVSDPTDDTPSVATSLGLNTDDQQYFPRSVLWRIYLGILPLPYAGTSLENVTSPWLPRLFNLRALYASHKQKFHECYSCFASLDEEFEATKEEMDAAVDFDEETLDKRSINMFRLSVSHAVNARKTSIGKGKSPLENRGTEIMEDIISLDIRRTYLNNDPEVPHVALFNILSVWRWLHPVVGYHQGMHEIAGYILQMLGRAALGVPENCPAEVAECANPAFREADAFFLFDAVMNKFGLSELFHASTVVGSHYQRSSVYSQDPGSVSCIIPERPELTALECVCEHIAFHLLRDQSSALYHHLANTNMFDQLLVFLPRWIRNLFTRELTTPQLMIVWDGIFAVFYSDEVERASRRRTAAERQTETNKKSIGEHISVRFFRPDESQGSPTNLRDTVTLPRTSEAPVVYAGTAEAKDLERGLLPIPHVSGAQAFSRTVLGVAVAILLHLEDDLLLLEDDFSILRRLTATPILNPLVDPLWLMNTAMAIANTRPPGIIPLHRKRDVPPTQTTKEWTKSAAAAAATRLTKEELMLQQRSVALVVQGVTGRLAQVLKVDLENAEAPAPTDVRLSQDDISIARGALRELQCVADRLAFV